MFSVFLVLCFSGFFMEFVESSSAVYFKVNSWPPSLAVSAFYFFCAVGGPLYLVSNML